MNTVRQHRRRIEPTRLLLGIAVGALVGFTGSLLVWAVAALAGVDIRITEGSGSETLVPLSVVPILLAVLIPSIAAGILLWVLQRLSSRAVTIFVVGSVVIAVASLTMPFGLNIDISARVALAAMHVVTATAIVGALIWATSNATAQRGES